jgi:hypothetical protein
MSHAYDVDDRYAVACEIYCFEKTILGADQLAPTENVQPANFKTTNHTRLTKCSRRVWQIVAPDQRFQPETGNQQIVFWQKLYIKN